jgi:hypothetical protein
MVTNSEAYLEDANVGKQQESKRSEYGNQFGSLS